MRAIEFTNKQGVAEGIYKIAINELTVNRNTSVNQWQLRNDTNLNFIDHVNEVILKNVKTVIDHDAFENGKRIFAYLRGERVKDIPKGLIPVTISFQRNSDHPFVDKNTGEPVGNFDYVKFDKNGSVVGYKQGVAEGFDKEADAWRKWQLDNLDRKMEMLSRLVKGWVPSRQDHITAIEAGYDAMKNTGDVKDAAKAIADTLKEIQRRQGVAEGEVKQFPKKHPYELLTKCPKCDGPLQGGKDEKGRLKLCMPCMTIYRAPNQQGVAEGSENDIIADKIFFARSKLTPKAWSYDHVGFITQDGKQIQMSGHKGNDVYITNAVTDDPEFPKQNIKIVSLPKPVSVPTNNSVGAENCGTFVANVLQTNGIKGFDTQKLYSVMKKPRQQEVAEDSIDEMALQTYKTMGDFSKPGPFTGADKRLVPHPKNIEKATRFFEQTPFDFRLFFSHLKGTGKYSEHGPMSIDQIRQVFGQDAEEIINGSEDAITVVYVGNKGDAKVMLTPWMMAHRFGHAINAGARNQNWTAWGEAENYFFQTVNNLLEEHYGKIPATRPRGRNILYQLTPEYNALFNAIGTQRSSKSGQIRRPYEFLYELFAQYLGTGKVTLNPLPTNLGYGRKVFGNPTKYMNIKPEYRDEGERKQAADSLAYTMELLFNDVLGDSVGKIFVM